MFLTKNQDFLNFPKVSFRQKYRHIKTVLQLNETVMSVLFGGVSLLSYAHPVCSEYKFLQWVILRL